MSEQVAVRTREKWVDAHTICGTDKSCPTKGRCYECSSSRCIGSWNWLCRADCSCVDYEENKVVRVLLVPE